MQIEVANASSPGACFTENTNEILTETYSWIEKHPGLVIQINEFRKRLEEEKGINNNNFRNILPLLKNGGLVKYNKGTDFTVEDFFTNSGKAYVKILCMKKELVTCRKYSEQVIVKASEQYDELLSRIIYDGLMKILHSSDVNYKDAFQCLIQFLLAYEYIDKVEYAYLLYVLQKQGKNGPNLNASVDINGAMDEELPRDLTSIEVDAEAGTTSGSNCLAFAKALGADNCLIGPECIITVSAKGGKVTNARTLAFAKSIGVSNCQIGDYGRITVRAVGGDTDGVFLEAHAQAVGALAYGGKFGGNIFLGDVFIDTESSTFRHGEAFQTFSLWAKSNGVNDLQVAGYVHKIKGDVYCGDNGQNIISLDTPDSYLQGNLLNGKNADHEKAKNIMRIAKGATWRPVFDNRYGTDCEPGWNLVTNVATNKVSTRTTSPEDRVVLETGGVIDLTWDGWTKGKYDVTRSYRSGDDGRFRRLYLGKVEGSGGIVKVDADLKKGKADVLLIGESSKVGTLGIRVNYDNYYDAAESTKAALTGKALVVLDGSGKLAVKGLLSEYNERTYEVTVAQDKEDKQKWNLVKIKDSRVTEAKNERKPKPKHQNEREPEDGAPTTEVQTEPGVAPVVEAKSTVEQVPTPAPKVRRHVTENTKHAADASANTSNIWLIETSSLRERLGDLRTMERTSAAEDNANAAAASAGSTDSAAAASADDASHAAGNIWAKFGHGSQHIAGNRNVGLQYNQFQIGYDKVFPCRKGKIYRGIYASRINGDASYKRGSGDTNSTTLGLYHTWLGKGGHYYDLVFKTGKIRTDYNVTDLSANYSTADYAIWATTVSGEYGYRWELGDGVYVEPSGEIILGHLGSGRYTTSKKMPVYVDAGRHAIGRLGCVIGKKITATQKTGDSERGVSIYISGDLCRDFCGGRSATTGGIRFTADHAKTWSYFALGGNVYFTKNCRIYSEIGKSFGDITTGVQYHLGARWVI